ncbi:hypothetical protein GCM10008967_19740 [Bacillus carboniphilus]|uniref:HMA domain-containing protein n=1 Tax=Bacillus carboniphilus TaxID=86663 RepID=A0ABP3FZC3_9BACI
MENMTIFVKEATSEQPIQSLENILMQIDGVERALVDMKDGEVKITYDKDKIASEEIIQRIEQHGMHQVQ